MPNSDIFPTLNLERFLPYRLAILSDHISRAIADRYENEFDISIPEWRVMAVLGQEKGMSAQSIASMSAMDKVAVSRAVNKLIDRGMIARSFADDDRRRSELTLSESGLAIYDQVLPIALQYEKQVLSKLTGGERDALWHIIEKLSQQT